MKCSPDTRDCPLRRQSRHGRRPAQRGATVKTGIGSRDKDTGLCNPLYTSRQRRPMPNLRKAVPRMFAAACSGCRRVFLCRCGQSAMMRCDDSLPTYGKRIGAYVQTHDTYGQSIYPYRKIYGQSITVYARTYGRTIPMQASQRALQHHAVGADRGDDVVHVGEGADHRRIVDRAGQVEEYEVERGLLRDAVGIVYGPGRQPLQGAGLRTVHAPRQESLSGRGEQHGTGHRRCRDLK